MPALDDSNDVVFVFGSRTRKSSVSSPHMPLIDNYASLQGVHISPKSHFTRFCIVVNADNKSQSAASRSVNAIPGNNGAINHRRTHPSFDTRSIFILSRSIALFLESI